MLAASQRHHDDPHGKHHHHHHHHHHHQLGVGGGGGGLGGIHNHHHHNNQLGVGGGVIGGGGIGVGGVGGGGTMSMSCSPAPDSSQDGVDDEKLDVVGTSDGRDGASPLHISDGRRQCFISFFLFFSPLNLLHVPARISGLVRLLFYDLISRPFSYFL